VLHRPWSTRLVQFNHYGGEAARLAASLINMPRPFAPETVERVLLEHHVVQTRLRLDECCELELWTERLASCFEDQEVEVRCHAINTLLDEAAPRPRISLHDGTPHLHYGSPDGGQLAHLQAITVAGLAYVVCFAGPDRLGRCLRPGCEMAFVDTSRNGRRRFCTARCGNSAAVARHRQRAAAAP
jgi:predicted RNA-binding Zn ribbon-like protein